MIWSAETSCYDGRVCFPFYIGSLNSSGFSFFFDCCRWKMSLNICFVGFVFLVYSFENTKNSESLKLKCRFLNTLLIICHIHDQLLYIKQRFLNQPPKQTNKIVLLFWQS